LGVDRRLDHSPPRLCISPWRSHSHCDTTFRAHDSRRLRSGFIALIVSLHLLIAPGRTPRVRSAGPRCKVQNPTSKSRRTQIAFFLLLTSHAVRLLYDPSIAVQVVCEHFYRFTPSLSLSMLYLHTKEIITGNSPHSRFLATLESLRTAIASVLCACATAEAIATVRSFVIARRSQDFGGG
jgi:hypothetical protein